MGDRKGLDSFWPRQIIRVTPETVREVARDGGESMAALSLAHIDILAGAAIHDNGCGKGAATSVIMANASPEVAATIKITGTDMDEEALGAYRARSTSSSWPADCLAMDANALSFPDETFTHSIGNAMIFLTGNNGVEAVREMHRTLKPGGTIIVNCFAYNPVLEPVREASRATRSGILPKWDSFEHWQDPIFIASALEAGGFARESISVEQREMIFNVGDPERHAALTWSFRGMPSTGWNQDDEARWDEAIRIVKREVRKTGGCKILEDGSMVIRPLINVATANKALH